MEKKELIRWVYLYLFTVVGLVLVVIGAVQLIDLGLKAYVFTKADTYISYPEYPVKPISAIDQKEIVLTPEQQAKYDEERKAADEANRQSQRQRTAANSVALLIVGAPLISDHWSRIQKGRRHS